MGLDSRRHYSGESAERFELDAICMAPCLQVFEEVYWRIGQHTRFNFEELRALDRGN